MDNKAERRESIRRVLLYWGNAERARREKADRIAEIEQEINAEYDLHPQALTGMPHGSGTSDPTADAAARSARRIAGNYAEKKRLIADIAEIDRICSMVEYEVMCLPPLEYDVIHLRYDRLGSVKKRVWEKIARRVHVSVDYAKKLERYGVDKLIKKIKVDTIGHDF